MRTVQIRGWCVWWVWSTAVECIGREGIVTLVQ